MCAVELRISVSEVGFGHHAVKHLGYTIIFFDEDQALDNSGEQERQSDDGASGERLKERVAGAGAKEPSSLLHEPVFASAILRNRYREDC